MSPQGRPKGEPARPGHDDGLERGGAARPASSAPTLGFDAGFQILIARVFFQDVLALSRVTHALRPDHFDVAACAFVFRAMRDHLADYSGPLTLPILAERLRAAIEAEDIAAEDVPGHTRLLERLAEPVLPGERECVLDQVSDFIVFQSLRKALDECLTLMPKGRWHDIRALLSKALDSGLRDLDLGLHYLRDAPARLLASREDALLRVAPTGIPELDNHLFRGGLGAGEMGLILAPTNRGKSIALLGFAKRALIGGGKVVVYTLEMSDGAVATRADAAFTGLPMSELEEHAEEVAQKLSALYRTYGDALIIKQWPPHVATVTMVRAHLGELAATGFRPDLVVIDYGDLMKPGSRYSERRHELAILFEEIRGLAVELDCPLWTATQANRSALKKEVVGLEDLSESFDKAMIADVVIALCQTPEEEQMDPPQMRLFLAKNRSERKGRIVTIENDFARMSFSRPKLG